MKTFGILIFVLVTILPFTTSADSPLTSTEFYKAYNDVTIIEKASKANGKLNRELMEFLVNEENPVDVKMALINRLGFKFGGKNNADKFLRYLKREKIFKSLSFLIENGSGDDLLCYAYLLAMDKYNNVAEALFISLVALRNNSESYTYNIITSLIKAQKQVYNEWENVYLIPDAVRKNKSLIVDMRKEAIDIIFNYIDIYKKYAEPDVSTILDSIEGKYDK